MSRHSSKEIERCKRIASKMTVGTNEAKAHSLHRMISWRPISTAPTKEREPIWLKVPGREPAAAYSDTFWISGFSAECKPTHWKPRTEPANDKLTDGGPKTL